MVQYLSLKFAVIKHVVVKERQMTIRLTKHLRKQTRTLNTYFFSLRPMPTWMRLSLVNLHPGSLPHYELIVVQLLILLLIHLDS